jgi:hypothetical protein
LNSPDTVSYYINWAEYLMWKQPRIQTYMQYLLVDPVMGNFASGLKFYPGKKKKSVYSAFRLPLYLPATTTRRGRSLEVWGAARPAKFYGGTAQIQFQPGSSGAFTTVKTLTIGNAEQYFDARIAFPGSGTVRLAYTYPTSASPSAGVSPLAGVPADVAGATVYSRLVKITVR